jgi:hypothetical protein
MLLFPCGEAMKRDRSTDGPRRTSADPKWQRCHAEIAEQVPVWSWFHFRVFAV